MEIVFRPATLKDLPEIIAMLADDPLGQQREDFRLPLPPQYLQAFRVIDQDPHQELMVAEDLNFQILGTFQMSFIPYLTYQGGWRAQVEAVRVHKSVRGQGLGARIFEWVINRAKDKGAHVLQLTTDKQRPGAIRFYEYLGFKASHEGMKLHFK